MDQSLKGPSGKPAVLLSLLAGGQNHAALIGRTFLRHFTMTYEGRTGTVIISND
jgi:hypothetical protein